MMYIDNFLARIFCKDKIIYEAELNAMLILLL